MKYTPHSNQWELFWSGLPTIVVLMKPSITASPCIHVISCVRYLNPIPNREKPPTPKMYQSMS